MEAVTAGGRVGSEGWRLTRGTLFAAAFAVMVAQLALAIPAVLQGLWQQDLHTTSSQLTWISDAFLLSVTLLELSFGVLGDLFGRKRLLVFGACAIVVGELIGILTPGMGSSTGTRVAVMWIGQAIAGIGAAALMPTTLAMIAAGTHTAEERGRAIAIWAAALSAGNVVSPVFGGLVVRLAWGSDATANWRWAFVLVLVLAAVSVGVSALMAENSAAPVGRSLDLRGHQLLRIPARGADRRGPRKCSRRGRGGQVRAARQDRGSRLGARPGRQAHPAQSPPPGGLPLGELRLQARLRGVRRGGGGCVPAGRLRARGAASTRG